MQGPKGPAGPAGKDGRDGRAPTEAEIRKAVNEWLDENPILCVAKMVRMAGHFNSGGSQRRKGDDRSGSVQVPRPSRRAWGSGPER